MMQKQNYTCSITANVIANEAFKDICNVKEWWSKNVDDKTEGLYDVFTYHPNDTWATFTIIKFDPGKKIV